MKKTYFYLLFCAVLAVIAGLSSCKKPVFNSNGNLSFSNDTITFDTVFTTVGSTTQQLKIYNTDNKTLNVSSIELVGGASSPFRINVDGVSGTNFANIELEGGDSLYIFVEVTLGENGTNDPMVIEDQIRFFTNGLEQNVILRAWGQDAYFHYTDYSDPNNIVFDLNSGTWPNDKPHVIVNDAYIDSATTLIIPAGTEVYCHKNAKLVNYKGVLDIQGTLTEPVTFQGDRLEAWYDDVAGQYFGIYFFESQESKVNYLQMKNGTSGLHIYGEDPTNTGYTVEVSNSTVQNCASYGTAVFYGASIKAENCIFAKNGGNQVLIGLADFNFNNCHILGYSNSGSSGNNVVVQNHFITLVNGVPTQFEGNINEGFITNSVIYGNGELELGFDTITGYTLNFNIASNLIRSDEISTDAFYSGNFWNIDPQFTDIEENDFTYPETSPLYNNGNDSFPNTLLETIFIAIDGATRSPGTRDIGAYEI